MNVICACIYVCMLYMLCNEYLPFQGFFVYVLIYVIYVCMNVICACIYVCMLYMLCNEYLPFQGFFFSMGVSHLRVLQKMFFFFR